MSELTPLNVSVISIPNVSSRVIAFSVRDLSCDGSTSLVTSFTLVIFSAISVRLSPKLSLYISCMTWLYSSMESAAVPVAAANLALAASESVPISDNAEPSPLMPSLTRFAIAPFATV